MAPIIRQASSSDALSVERIVRAAYAKYVARIGKPPGPMNDDYAARIAQQAVWLLIASGEIAGILVLLEEDDHLLLDNVAVDPRHQGKGIGRALIGFAEQEARRRAHTEIRLYTHQAMHENIAMYPQLGYEEIGRGEQAGFQRVFFRKILR